MSMNQRRGRRVAALLAGLTLLVTAKVPDRMIGGVALPIDSGQRADTPAPGHALPADRDWVEQTLRRMSLEDKVGQLFVTVAYGQTADAVDGHNREEFGVDTPAELVRRYHLGGIIYFRWSSGLRSPQQVAMLSNGLQQAALTSGAGVPLLISTDQENGAIVRIGPPATPLPTPHELGATGSADNARAAAAISGRELRAMGVNHDLAPVADVNLNPANPVLGKRTFSSDPTLVATMTGAQVAGYQESLVATAKHFPGHGGTRTDSHVAVPVIEHDRDQWERLDAPPFRAAVAAGVDAIMVGHVVLPMLDPSGSPATLSPAIVTGLLRDELGYRGVVITDSLRMQGVRAVQRDDRVPVLAIAAGADLLLMPPNLELAYRSVLDAVRTGELTEQRIDASVRRVLELKWRRGMVAAPLVDTTAVQTVVGSPQHREIAKRLTRPR